MDISEKIFDSVGKLISSARDVPTEKLCVIGLAIIGVCAVAANRSQSVGGSADVAKKIIDTVKK